MIDDLLSHVTITIDRFPRFCPIASTMSHSDAYAKADLVDKLSAHESRVAFPP